MSTWSGLGFDPAPGEPAAAGGLARQLADTGRYLRETHAVLTSVREQRGSWTGAASTAFAEKLGSLPRYLDDAQSSLGRAGAALQAWEGSLGALQAKARDLETRAAAARTQLVAAQDVEQRARLDDRFTLVDRLFSATDLPEAQRRVDAAQAALNQAVATSTRLRDSLEDLIRQGRALQGEHAADAARTADGIRRADDGLAPPEPAWFEEALEWVGEHLGEIGDVAGAVSAVAGTLALIPVLTPFAGPVALVAGGVALLAHGADMVVSEKYDDPDAWVGLVGDVVGLVPGLKVLGAAADGAVGSLRTVEGLSPAVSAGWHAAWEAVPQASREVGEAGALADRAARALTPAIDRVLPTLTGIPGAVADPAVVAKSLGGAVNLGVQVPLVDSWLEPERDVETAQDVAGYVGAAKSLGDLGLGMLRASAGAGS